ncbi:MAG: hypothetical protein IT306_17690 [Chloroflexi bacterium]|nr:hypothetical protein [Chloroflexota bacterium]
MNSGQFGGPTNQADGINWDRVGTTMVRTGFFTRLLGIAIGASLTAGLLADIWRWLRRPPAR